MKNEYVDITEIRSYIENAYELKEQIGVFSILNTPEKALDGYDSFISAKNDGAYYCLHKYTKRLQLVVKHKSFKWLYIKGIPKQKGELINIVAIEVWKAKKKTQLNEELIELVKT
ncbi:MAG: hypothetical protein ACOVP7_08510 [Lacibacter sp.]